MSFSPAQPTGTYNAAVDLLDRNLALGRGDKIAVIDDSGPTTYAALAARANRAANALTALGVQPEQRLLMCMQDTVDFPAVFLGAIKAGIIPVPVNTMLTAEDFDYLLADSGARGLVVSQPLLPAFTPILHRHRERLRHVIVAGGDEPGRHSLDRLLADAPDHFSAAPTVADDICFWLYSSGSTGRPKGAVHIHNALICTARLYAEPVLGLSAEDTVFSAAKLFFAYGLGNSLTFPFAVGATAVLMAERPTPAAVAQRLKAHRPTVFYGVPTLFAAMLASPDLPKPGEHALRLCTSAGEALPAELGRRWRDRMGVDLLDGIGSTEMLHIFISNRPGDIRYGATGRPAPGYEARLVGEDGAVLGPDEIGELQVSGPTACAFYWRQREKSRATFLGPWTRTGDKYIRSADGYYTSCGRADDMMKVGGQYVSPYEVEGALLSHPAVLEAAVVGDRDGEGLEKPRAFVVLQEGHEPGETLEAELKAHVKGRLAPFKYPRWVEFREALPKTATGKIQRFMLRRPDS